MHLAKLILLLIFTFFSQLSVGQVNQDHVKHREIYGFRIKGIKILGTKKMKCGIGLADSHKNTLYEISVEDVLFSRDSTIYNIKELESIEYVILPTSIKIDENKEYFLLAGNSSVTDYVVGFRIFESNLISSMTNTDKHSIFQGLEICYQLSLIDKIKLVFGTDTRKVYTRHRDEKKKNKFYKLIKKFMKT